MFTDEHRVNVWNEIRQHDLRAFSRFLTPTTIRDAAKRTGKALGRGPLHLGNLVWLAVASALHTAKSFADVLPLTLKLLSDTENFGATPLAKAKKRGQHRKKSRKRSKHDPRRADPTVVSEEAFVKARQRMPLAFCWNLLLALAERFQSEHGQFVRWKGFRLLALDGTMIPLPSWQPLTKHFGTANNGKGRRRTQARMLLLQFPLARIPYAYELSPVAQSEKTGAVKLFSLLQANDLILLDRGFWSYGLFWQIQRQKAFFGIRLFRTAGLKHLRKLGPKDRLVQYAPTDRKWRKAGLPRSITLRVIDYQIPGFRPSAVVTNVTDSAAISSDDWVRLSTESDPGRRLDPGLYHRRWEIETSFSELKVIQGMKGGLRSRTPEGIAFEVAGHILFYLLVRWMMVEAAVKHGHPPLRLSFTHALRELHDVSEKLVTSPMSWVRRVLILRLLARIASHLVPLRPGRHYSRPNDTKTKNIGKGRIRLPSKLPEKSAKPRYRRICRRFKG
jgi:hypothetical protein